VVDEKGNITEVEPVRDGHPLFDRAAIAAVKKLPPMVPGSQLGKNVKVRYLIPVRFVTE
ncbi:MAG: energy transducer TonB, partial [Flavobacteriales bacterium]|nr:energy transducer TonB [Flavobacteriales bacterium]